MGCMYPHNVGYRRSLQLQPTPTGVSEETLSWLVLALTGPKSRLFLHLVSVPLSKYGVQKDSQPVRLPTSRIPSTSDDHRTGLNVALKSSDVFPRRPPRQVIISRPVGVLVSPSTRADGKPQQ